MASSVLERHYLTNTLAGHSKFYEITLFHESVRNRYRVVTKFGRIGYPNSNAPSTVEDTAYQSAAKRKMQKILTEKLGKGYKEIVGGKAVEPEKIGELAKSETQIQFDRFLDLE